MLCETAQDGDGEWSYYVNSVVAFGKIRIITDEAERTDKLRKLGLKVLSHRQKWWRTTSGKNAARALVLELDIEST